MKRIVMAVATSLVVLAGAASAAWAAPAVPPAARQDSADGCSTTTKTLYFPSEDQPRWSYTDSVTWCLVGGEIVLSEWPEPEIRVVDDACAVVGEPERRETPGDGTRAWLSMGTISCHDGAEPYQLNPWVDTLARVNGTHELSSGIAGSPYE